ncbi:MAG: hypothetical protein LBK74_00445 [Treponema sp.]|jgi:hypothetical protein|nr:hypothetical protein [Treponema sp.]
MAKVPQGRKYTVDTHPDRERIIAEIINGDRSFRNIAERYGIPVTCISTYLNKKLIAQAASVLADDGGEKGTALLTRIESVVKRMQRLYDACDEYLRDPSRPDRYDLGPRAWEIEVSYRFPDPKNPKKLTAGRDTLNNLLMRLEERKIHPTGIRFRHADPRKLIIDTAGTLTKQLELIAKIKGQIFGGDTNATVNVLVINRKNGEEEQNGS